MKGSEFCRWHAQRQALPSVCADAPSEQATTYRRPPTPQPLAPTGYLVIPSDRIHKATVEALAPGAIRSLSPEFLRSYGILPGETFWAAYPFETGKRSDGTNTMRGLVGFPREPEGAIWQMLQRNGALAVKAQYALWARAYAETDAMPGVFISISVPQFCDDLGYSRHHSGAHRPERKRQAMEILKLLTSIELCGTYIPPRAKPTRLRGNIWTRGVIGEQYDGYADLFGAARLGDPAKWDPVAFSYAPGPFFADRAWHQYNRNVALVGKGLLGLGSDDADKWAVMAGGYIATLARMHGYAPRVLRVTTLLERTGMANTDRRNPGRMLDRLERALDRIQEVGVIGSWEYTGTEAIEPDMDDADDLASLADAAEGRAAKCIIVGWPSDLSEREARFRLEREKREAQAIRQIQSAWAEKPAATGRR